MLANQRHEDWAKGGYHNSQLIFKPGPGHNYCESVCNSNDWTTACTRGKKLGELVDVSCGGCFDGRAVFAVDSMISRSESSADRRVPPSYCRTRACADQDVHSFVKRVKSTACASFSPPRNSLNVNLQRGTRVAN